MSAKESSTGLEVGHSDGCEDKDDEGYIDAQLGQVPFGVVLGHDSVEGEKDGGKAKEDEN